MKTMSESTRKTFVEKCVKDVENFKEDKLDVAEGKKFRDEEMQNEVRNEWNKRALKLIEKFL